MYFKKKTAKSKRHKTDPIGSATVKDFRKGDYVRINGKEPIYIRGEYDRETKKYHLIDTRDVYGNGRYVKGSTPANDNFTY